ncbi:hypothetical protein [Enteractinococcus helveticum]|uniref:Uncharacterized protein n=1 Tax=Enteractinococcus helveticum TaxID=1837282 RepID=A0A1B7LVD6_9MICC|nr:hypothetical protein [Enteractinococcus helveticum]OAV52204.1 hypothetical protein A6F49_00865 [Enteractinococcus helveticum]
MKQLLQKLFGFVFLAGFLGLLVWLLRAIVSWFLALNPETQTPLAALFGVVSVPIITYFTSRSLERKRSRETAIREKKTELYDDMIRGFMRMLNLKKKEPMDEDAMVDFFADITPKLITYGSRGVIRAWSDFRLASIRGQTDTSHLMLILERLLKEMRKDLGHGIVLHQDGELLSVFINDVDEILNKK